jgi:mRNA-degrading endonuclease RelE of RelBE toxin-antitoxin system
MLPIYLYKKMMLEKRANPYPFYSWTGPVPTGLGVQFLSTELTPPSLPNAPPNLPRNYQLGSKPTTFGRPLVWAIPGATPYGTERSVEELGREIESLPNRFQRQTSEKLQTPGERLENLQKRFQRQTSEKLQTPGERLENLQKRFQRQTSERLQTPGEGTGSRNVRYTLESKTRTRPDKSYTKALREWNKLYNEVRGQAQAASTGGRVWDIAREAVKDRLGTSTGNLFRGVGGGRLKALGILGSLIAGYGALSMAEPYFVRRLRETAYGGPGIEKKYTAPAHDLYEAAKSQEADQQAENFFNAVRQRFNELQKGNYVPGVFDKVTGSFQDYENKRTIFSPIWNALRYLNIFSSHSAPVYEKHYRTPEELLHALRVHAKELEDRINDSYRFMGETHYQNAQRYLNQLRQLISDYSSRLNVGGVGHSGTL